MYTVVLVLFATFTILSWLNTTASDGGSVAFVFIVLGAFAVLYGWLFVRRLAISVWNIREEDALKLARGMCFEWGALFIIAGILFSLRYCVHS
jgi:amino acid permease